MEKKKFADVALERFKKYVAAYSCHPNTTKVFIHDMLYGIGIVIGPKKYKWYKGFQKFKKEILYTFLRD